MFIYGKNTIKEAIKAKRKIYQLYLDANFKDNSFISFLKLSNQPYQLVDKKKLFDLVKQKNHQGVVAQVESYQFYDLDSFLSFEKKQRFLILDAIHDPHNLGAILRTVEACGFDGVIMSKKHQVPLNATVSKIACGALEYVKVFLVSNLHQTILKLQKQQVLIIGTDSNATQTLTKIPCNQSLAIIVGNEGDGIRYLLKQKCDLLVKIPMKGKINSLNVSVASALMMYATLLSY
ncbi:tRNA/rRNA methyltransferase [Candidatus Phytoplasma australiense]|uniref:tRNA/rRNA methyltransferase n=2 Tax=Phytoplasma australiense TaxID=59748 RepID=B1VAN3_PHYAS|nr:23S rRNA (guanosine(2251)-2'-O)-methyltransferase RlmB [Candidatus Phytoplasma australiense]AGL90402.1 TRNA/RRNA Methyltransferase [Strawberry lethal yellows phytoplasma (CPA) str. NZSb11]CAM12006.1 tRNA/rRNA methyltransferase [Candidatus Phytoplasma australiense]